MQTPTLDECLFHAGKIGLVPVEAEKFFCYFASNGWKVGKNPMKNWQMAMRGWQLRCQCPPVQQSKGIDKVIMMKELEMVEAGIRAIKNSYDPHQSWSQSDYNRFAKLRQRLLSLKTLLGIKT